ncbi:phosphoribosylanthranilate isomerase [Oceanobacillus saliphilus]|uniref:phosphoribosylanthranilate isomerase n=1 Tax=Oceanobacillus saliphilus TaxID=2925834 RepID=UPI00201E3AC6|nr:phosphoribosylanthranilate isomerase [Oceanobacillus saliphilus]
MFVKICGITTQEAADAAVEAGADFIGFLFAESKRKISPADAASIAETIPVTVKKVGVFVNETLENMKRTAEIVGLDVIQLHGEEPSEVAEQLPYEIIKAFPATKEALQKLNNYPCHYFLLDTPSNKRRGGNGITFDWSLLDTLQVDRSKMILAGGLTPENVNDGINKVAPAGVDVSSGVETDGKKDITKINLFIANAKQTKEG